MFSSVWNAVINQSASRPPECWLGRFDDLFWLSLPLQSVTLFCIVNRGLRSLSLCALHHTMNNSVPFCGRLFRVDVVGYELNLYMLGSHGNPNQNPAKWGARHVLPPQWWHQSTLFDLHNANITCQDICIAKSKEALRPLTLALGAVMCQAVGLRQTEANPNPKPHYARGQTHRTD